MLVSIFISCEFRLIPLNFIRVLVRLTLLEFRLEVGGARLS